MKAPTPPKPRSRGIGGVQKPAAGNLKGSGIGDLKSPRVAGQAPQKGVPAADEPTIKAMQSAAQNGEDAGAAGGTATRPPQRKNIPGRDAIVPPAGFHVP
jgi:hypothetical protein